jgi:medium-chain acyl-[acyl-carrier-protein] hydrolase
MTSHGPQPALLCFPYAAGTTAEYRDWPAALGDLVDVVPVEVAGHGARRNEPLPLTFEAALVSTQATLARAARGRYGLFGHSLGALYAFEAARRLTRAGRPPALLVASGRNGPARAAAGQSLHQLPDEEFVARLSTYGGIPPALLADRDLVRFFLPLLRTDMAIAERYARPPGPAPDRLNCPIVVFSCVGDPLTSREGAAAWEQETSAGCEFVELAGGHFCLRTPDYLGRLRAAMAKHLARHLTPAPTGQRGS